LERLTGHLLGYESEAIDAFVATIPGPK